MNKAEEVLTLAKEIVRREAELEELRQRFYARFESGVPPRGGETNGQRHYLGKVPDPNSNNTRVLALLKAGPRTVESMATELGITEDQARAAVNYHRKKRRVVHAGAANTYAANDE